MTSRLKKASYSAIIGLGLFAGAVGIAAAASGSGNTPTPRVVVARTPEAVTPAAKDTPDAYKAPEARTPEAVTRAAKETPDAYKAPDAEDADEANGVNCENGYLNGVVGVEFECDGGPSFNQDDDLNEPAGGEDADEANGEDADEANGVNCENGYLNGVVGVEFECDGGPSFNQDDDQNEPAGAEDDND